VTNEEVYDQACDEWVEDCRKADIPFKEMKLTQWAYDEAASKCLPKRLLALYMLASKLLMAADKETTDDEDMDIHCRPLFLMRVFIAADLILKSRKS
jgi:hypothetical protein